jgi:anti-sigma factor RsiW
VKPWFAGRTPFSPEVPRLDSLGYPLLGGRVDQVGDHAAAGIVYGLRKHYIDVYTWPAEARERTAKPDTVVRTERGYHTVHWIQGDMEYWAVSDVAEPDLRAFVTAFERYAGPESGNGPSTTSPE